jgi:molybdenum cofactor guanylyltransferase
VRVAGVVLCGGHSRRMGRPKAWLPFGPELMLPRVVRLLGEAVQPVVVVAAAGQDLPPLQPGVVIVRDERQDRGPLQGLVAGLCALRDHAEAAYLSSCDVPLLRPAFVRRLIELLGEYTICAPKTANRPHPLAAVYRLEAVEAAQQLLAKDRLRLSTLLDILPTRFVAPEELADADPTLDSLRNVNTPDDYEAALRMLSP